MATLAEMQERLAGLDRMLATGVLRATYQGRTTEFRSVEELERVRAGLLRDIAAASSARPVRVIYTPGSKFL